MINKSESTEIEVIYGIHDKPKLSLGIPLAIQHILAMFVANITVPLLVSSLLGLSSAETTFLIQCAILMAGVTTFIQVMRYRFGIGSGLPIVMGTSNAFIPVVVVIATDYGIGAVLVASFIGGLFEIILGRYLIHVKRIFTPLVAGIVVLTIGITLIPVGIRQAAGGSSNMGDLTSLAIAGLVLLTIIIFNQSKNKVLKSSSILIGIGVGYVVSILLGLVDITPVIESSWLSFPQPFQYQWTFEPVAIIAMLFMYIATAIESVGDISAITNGAEGREATKKELRGGVVADGISSSIAALFNAFPNTSYSQNIGVVNLTGVFSVFVIKIGAVILILLSLLPKFAAFITIMPQPVLGGAAVAMFAMVAVSGVSLLKKIKLDSRNILIIAVALGLGIGFNVVPEATQQLPENVQLILTTGLVPAALVAILLDLLLPKKQ
ncbi:uracil-xanthine permease family protein [Bacillus horti]|uniref:NCS2 family nucleobase:cation symporter-2 n=1 Tax=Caldalkalibacillus horti TaxID=77523 RepID=A0ABT9W3U4_9BACI|nr:nucleobase:cation symporter-2 family protein [Bacillus horti]MDQ0167734.1 NCS2 family nucleobase:cation symporter-2 [Bacillus horti]